MRTTSKEEIPVNLSIRTTRRHARALVAVLALTSAAPAAAADEFVPGVTDFPSRLVGTQAEEPFIPGVTDFPSRLVGEPREPFVPGVTDFPSRLVGEATQTAAGEPSAQPAAPIASDRFDWGDAGIGAGVTAGALLLAAAAAIAARKRIHLAH